MGTTTQATKQEYRRHPFALATDEVTSHLQTKLDTGLSRATAQDYKTKYGENKLSGEGGVKWWTVLAKQISNAMILVGNSRVCSMS